MISNVIDFQKEKQKKQEEHKAPPEIYTWKPFEIKPRAFYLSQEYQDER